MTSRRLRLIPALLVLAMATRPAAVLAAGDRPPRQEVLRVGVVEGSPPCSVRQGGGWSGLAVDLWAQIASREQLAYELVPHRSLSELLAATAAARVDVAVQCINISPERLQRYRFTLPFQEDGLAVLVASNQVQTGLVLLQSALGQGLLQVLGIYLLLMLLLGFSLWRIENAGRQDPVDALSRRRQFVHIVQILATGPGSNTLVTTIRGNGVVLLAYLVRVVSASVLVGVVTVNVVADIQLRNRGNIKRLDDLRGLRVAARPGSVSEQLLLELNATGQPPVQRVTLPTVAEALPLLAQGRVQAVVADTLQLRSLLAGPKPLGLQPTLALQDIRPEGQGFVLSPQLPQALVDRLDLAISSLKREGVVSALRENALTRGRQP